MGKRSRMNRAARASVPRTAALVTDSELDHLLDEMQKMAEDAMERAKASLRAAGAQESDLVLLQNTSRLVCISEIQKMDLLAMLESMTKAEVDEGVGLTNKIVEVLMKGLLPGEDHG
jgi:hypothetical protein